MSAHFGTLLGTASSRAGEAIVLTLLGGVMTSLSLLIMDQPPRGGGAKKLWGGENLFYLWKLIFCGAEFFFQRRRNESCGGSVEEGLDKGGGARKWRSYPASYLEQTLMNLTRIRGGIFPSFPQCFPRLWLLRILIWSNFNSNLSSFRKRNQTDIAQIGPKGTDLALPRCKRAGFSTITKANP